MHAAAKNSPQTYDGNVCFRPRSFIPVLPGAFCAFRWEAMKDAPLREYFKDTNRPQTEMSGCELNAMLAEDRLLVMYLVGQTEECWTVRPASCSTQRCTLSCLAIQSVHNSGKVGTK